MINDRQLGRTTFLLLKLSTNLKTSFNFLFIYCFKLLFYACQDFKHMHALIVSALRLHLLADIKSVHGYLVYFQKRKKFYIWYIYLIMIQMWAYINSYEISENFGRSYHNYHNVGRSRNCRLVTSEFPMVVLQLYQNKWHLLTTDTW
jgi:hypothetical protein